MEYFVSFENQLKKNDYFILGYRSVQLFDKHGEPIPLASLLLHIQIEKMSAEASNEVCSSTYPWKWRKDLFFFSNEINTLFLNIVQIFSKVSREALWLGQIETLESKQSGKIDSSAGMECGNHHYFFFIGGNKM